MCLLKSPSHPDQVIVKRLVFLPLFFTRIIAAPTSWHLSYALSTFHPPTVVYSCMPDACMEPQIALEGDKVRTEDQGVVPIPQVHVCVCFRVHEHGTA